jgi:hypothetical protein
MAIAQREKKIICNILFVTSYQVSSFLVPDCMKSFILFVTVFHRTKCLKNKRKGKRKRERRDEKKSQKSD